MQSSKKNSNVNHQLNSITDYRNGKYQGQISSYVRLPNGQGMFLDSDYLLTLGNWKNGFVEGQSITIYPNGSIFYGLLKDNEPIGMTSFQLENGKIIYSFINNSDNDLFFLEDNHNKTIMIVKSPHSYLEQLFQKQNRQRQISQQLLRLSREKMQLIRKNVKIVQQVNYRNQTQKWDIIQQHSKQIIKSQFKDFRAFLKFNFCNTAQNKLDITQTKEQLQFGYKKTSIICHISEDIKGRNQGKIKLVGFYDEHQKRMDIYKKIIYGITREFEENCQGLVYKYSSRPKQVKKNLINYYKKSSNFVNKYITTTHYDRIRFMYETIIQISQTQVSLKKAQNLLQMGVMDSDNSPAQRQKYKQALPRNSQLNHITLSEIRNDVYNRAKKRRNSNSEEERSLSRKVNDYIQRQIKDKVYYQKNEPSLTKTKSVKYLQNSPSKHQKQYLKYTQNYRPDRRKQYPYEDNDNSNIRSNNSKSRKYSYVPQNRNENSINHFQIQQNHGKKNLRLNLFHSKSEYTLQNQQRNDIQQQLGLDINQHDRPGYFYKSINALTKYYEKINDKLLQQRKASSKKFNYQQRSPSHAGNYPQSKLPKKYNYLKSPTLSPTSSSSKIKKGWR